MSNTGLTHYVGDDCAGGHKDAAAALLTEGGKAAIREGVQAAKEGRVTPADTFFNWMRAKYVRDIWDAQVERLTEERDRARDALKCQVCGKQKPYVAICFDCLGEDVEEIARWHREVGLSDADGTADICNQCHTGWPCDAIKALKLQDEAHRQLAAVATAAVTNPHNRWAHCLLCGTTWRPFEGEAEFHGEGCVLADLPAAQEIAARLEQGEAAQARYISAVRKAEEAAERAEKLAEALRTIPFGGYGDAQRDGCDSDDAWDCFCDVAGKHIDAALREEGK